jgi:hypothetical protein
MFSSMEEASLTPAASVALLGAAALLAAGCQPVVPYHAPPHAAHPSTTGRADGHGSTLPSSEMVRAGGIYAGAGGQPLDEPVHGLHPEGQYGGAGYGSGTYAPLR